MKQLQRDPARPEEGAGQNIAPPSEKMDLPTLIKAGPGICPRPFRDASSPLHDG